MRALLRVATGLTLAFLYAPLIVILVAYPLLSLDQISVELQNPFCRSRLSHLPLNDICATIQKNLLGMLDLQSSKSRQSKAPAREEFRALWADTGESPLAESNYGGAQHTA